MLPMEGYLLARNHCRRIRRSMINFRLHSIITCVIFLLGLKMWAQETFSIQASNGLRMEVISENTQPSLHMFLPDADGLNSPIEILFPEHVTVRKHGHHEPEHLYVFRPGKQGKPPSWSHRGNSLEYEKTFRDSLHMLARATLDEDGLRLEYTFTNASKGVYDMIYAVTDPRLTSVFHDVLLERTYVHHPEGFALLASETPERLHMPLNKWLPCRYHASYTWPVPSALIRSGANGITYYNKSYPVDYPFIATLSKDSEWVVASFTPQLDKVGNVWSNPELTCQHVDPQDALLSGEHIILEVSLLIVKGSLEEAFSMARRQMDKGH